jgi:hypothetical protein
VFQIPCRICTPDRGRSCLRRPYPAQSSSQPCDGGSAFAEFSRLERRVERAEAVSDAYDRLEGRDPDAEALATKFAAEERRRRLDAEFAALKERVGPAESPTIMDYMKRVWDACE